MTDQLTLEKIFLANFPNLTEEWISSTLTLQALDDRWIFAKLENIQASFIEDCEVCSNSYERAVQIPIYSANFLDIVDLNEIPTGDEEVFLIDMKGATIDIEEMLYHAIGLAEPLLKRCSTCEALLDSAEDAEREDYEDLRE